MMIEGDEGVVAMQSVDNDGKLYDPDFRVKDGWLFVPVIHGVWIPCVRIEET